MRFLGEYPTRKVEEAFETYVKNRSRFPTPNDIIGIIEGRIKRDGFYYNHLIKKAGSRSREENIYIEKYEKSAAKDWE